ncbi:MAG: hypothetical protein LBK00_00555 [Treponema sp.]|jgi:hypothetical protein|nr:hypothetical protein [Treponema sp.]
MLEFNPALHEYRAGDVVVPSVTHVLKTAGIVNDRFLLQLRRGIGAPSLTSFVSGTPSPAGGR